MNTQPQAQAPSEAKALIDAHNFWLLRCQQFEEIKKTARLHHEAKSTHQAWIESLDLVSAFYAITVNEATPMLKTLDDQVVYAASFGEHNRLSGKRITHIDRRENGTLYGQCKLQGIDYPVDYCGDNLWIAY